MSKERANLAQKSGLLLLKRDVDCYLRLLDGYPWLSLASQIGVAAVRGMPPVASHVGGSRYRGRVHNGRIASHEREGLAGMLLCDVAVSASLGVPRVMLGSARWLLGL